MTEDLIVEGEICLNLLNHGDLRSISFEIPEPILLEIGAAFTCKLTAIERVVVQRAKTDRT